MEKRGISIIGMILRLAVLLGLTFAAANARAGEVEPWKERRNAIIVDAYELNSIDWEAMVEADGVARPLEEHIGDVRAAQAKPRRRHSFFAERRPRFLVRRSTGSLGIQMKIDGREIIARA